MRDRLSSETEAGAVRMIKGLREGLALQRGAIELYRRRDPTPRRTFSREAPETGLAFKPAKIIIIQQNLTMNLQNEQERTSAQMTEHDQNLSC